MLVTHVDWPEGCDEPAGGVLAMKIPVVFDGWPISWADVEGSRKDGITAYYDVPDWWDDSLYDVSIGIRPEDDFVCVDAFAVPAVAAR